MLTYFIVQYFLNFVNTAFIVGILSIWLSEKIDLIETPKTSKKPVNKKLYKSLFYLLLVSTIATSISLKLHANENIIIAEIILIGIFLFGYLTKPFEYKIEPSEDNTIIERIIQMFLIMTVIIAIFGLVFSYFSYDLIAIDDSNLTLYIMTGIIMTDIIIVLFFIP